MCALPLLVVGVSCHTAPLATREKVALGEHERAGVLRQLLADGRVQEAAVLFTCNRTEFYLIPADEGPAMDFFASRGLEGAELDAIYRRVDIECARHLFRVASGLDSPVLGETQVLGQVKHALSRAQIAGTAGPVVSTVFGRAVAAARRVHNRTGLGGHGFSASAAAVDVIAEALGGLKGRRILLVGAGEMCELAACILAGDEAEVTVCSRSLNHASELADRHGFRVAPWDRLWGEVRRAEAVISGTASPGTVLTSDGVADAVCGRSLVICDLAVPRDVDLRVQEVPGVCLWDLDALHARARGKAAAAEAAVAEAEAIVEEEVAAFARWWSGRDVAPLIQAVRRRYHALAREEVDRALDRLGVLTPKQRRVVEEMARKLVNKALHGPIKAMHGWAARGEAGAPYLHALEEAFLAPGSREERRAECNYSR